MQLTKKHSEKLKRINIIKATQEARIEANRLLDDQGFAVLSVAVSHFIADIVKHPEKLAKEFAH